MTHGAPLRRLIINADDFGISAGVNAGIVEAFEAGSITATSMLVGCPGWDDAVRRARGVPTLDVGLHLNFLVGTPLARAPSLTDRATGRFASLPTLVSRALLRAVDPDEVAAECEAQVAAVRNAGISVTHIDSHRHTHALPVIRRAVAGVATRLGLALRRPVESSASPFVGIGGLLHQAVVDWSWRFASFGAPVTRAADHFAGISLQGGARFDQRLLALLDALGPGTTELMVHPGRTDADLARVDAYTWQRERELAALLSPPVRDRLRRGDLTLVGFGAL